MRTRQIVNLLQFIVFTMEFFFSLKETSRTFFCFLLFFVKTRKFKIIMDYLQEEINDDYLNEDEILELYWAGHRWAAVLVGEIPLVARDNLLQREHIEYRGFNENDNFFNLALENFTSKIQSKIDKLQHFDKLYVRLIASLRFEETRYATANPRRILRPSSFYNFQVQIDQINDNNRNQSNQEWISSARQLVSNKLYFFLRKILSILILFFSWINCTELQLRDIKFCDTWLTICMKLQFTMRCSTWKCLCQHKCYWGSKCQIFFCSSLYS